MGGMHHVERLLDGAMQGAIAPFGVPTGLSALDLYLMGMIGEEDVPNTVLVTGSAASADGEHREIQTVPVRVADIIAACGPRTPSVQEAQRRFTIGIYVLFEDGREPVSDKLAQPRGIEAALIEYFSVATGGRMVLELH